jgi:hypothetical protein
MQGSGRRWRTGARALLALTMIGSALAATALPATADDGHTVKGYLSLQDSAVFVGKVCQGAGGYTDLEQGTPVVIRDGDGEIIGTGHFTAGRGAGRGKVGVLGAPSACVFAFTVKHVPDTDTYLLELSHRGRVVYTHAELEANKWRVGAALGSAPASEIA